MRVIVGSPHTTVRTTVAALTFAIMAASAASDRVALVTGEGLREPFGVDFDRAGNTYIVEMEGSRVSVIDREGRQRVLAGTGEAGLSGDGGQAGGTVEAGAVELQGDLRDRVRDVLSTRGIVVKG